MPKRYFLDIFSTPEQPPQITLHSLDHDAKSTEVFVQQLSIGIASQLQPPEYMEILSPEGLILHGMLYRPPATYGAGPYPTIVCVYGGPHVQQVARAWSATVDMRAQYLSSLGYPGL